jgi:hypothetical protein
MEMEEHRPTTPATECPLTNAVQPPAAATPDQHRAFAALRAPDYGIYLLGSTLAMMADSIEHVISYWIIF